MSYNNSIAGIQRVAIICRGKTAQSISGWTTLLAWTEIQDPTNNLDPATGVFTAPRAGLYSFSIGDALSQAIGAYYGLSILKNGVQLYNTLQTAQSASIQYLSLSGEVEMLAGETLSARAYCAATASDSPSASNSWFTISEKIINY
jgi:hypothetical protein